MRALPFCVVASLALSAQEAAFFHEETPSLWKPAWELTLRGDRTGGLGDEDFQRVGARLRLRWRWDLGPLETTLATRHAVGSDGNARNFDRYDNLPSNESRLDLAQIAWRPTAPKTFLEVRIGLQETGLLSQESYWDRDLRVLGGGVRAAYRDGKHVQELGLRGVAGRVRTVQGGRIDVAALQAVLKLDTGAFSWTAHAGRWHLKWDPSEYRLRALPGANPTVRQHSKLDVAGVGVLWNSLLPLEFKAVRHRNPDTREDGAETQFWVGSRNRAWWPQVGYIWQRFEKTGTHFPVNGDDWWYYWNARGPRYELALPLPGNWLVSAVYLRHFRYGADEAVTRRLLILTKRF
ncbi:MAG TPA: hypothetical protein DD435_09635 [Cyanobacteria bacterium UBA8530]|nr:hypothetical protein [Cyanobacteria bacterium UBA8530]